MSYPYDPNAAAREGFAHKPILAERAVRVSSWDVVRALIHIAKYCVEQSYGARP